MNQGWCRETDSNFYDLGSTSTYITYLIHFKYLGIRTNLRALPTYLGSTCILKTGGPGQGNTATGVRRIDIDGHKHSQSRTCTWSYHLRKNI
jgi:hypothetical protein